MFDSTEDKKPDFGIWVEKYRPEHVKDLILDDETKSVFLKIIETGAAKLPNILAYGTPGVGKTTILKALVRDLDADSIFINASKDSNIDLIRDKISQFAKTVSMKKGKKVVILDEVDGVTSNAFFPALRPFIEQFSKNCVFFMTCNNVDKVPDAIMSRLQTYHFTIPDKKAHAIRVMKRCEEILKAENVSYDKEVLAQIIKTNFPDIRKTIQTLDQWKDFLNDKKLKFKISGGNVEPLILALKEKDFAKINEFVQKDLVITDTIYRSLFDSLYTFVEKESMATAILIMDDYMRTHHACVDSSIHVIAFLIEFAKEVKIKV